MSDVSAESSGSRKPIPVTCFTGFLGAGKTTTILGLLKQLPKDYKVVLLKNEYGDVEVDSLLASQSNITGVSEILNGCLCCTMVGLVENAMIEVRDKFSPDRIVIESSGSAFPATLALQIRQLEPQGFKLDGVVTVIDCVNFRGYEDTSPSAKLQAKYTDLLLLNKHQLVSENGFDILMDHLGTLNDETPRIRIGPNGDGMDPEIIFGLDTGLWEKSGAEGKSWADLAGEGKEAGWHGDEVEVRGIRRGGRREQKKGCGGVHEGHDHGPGCGAGGKGVKAGSDEIRLQVVPLERDVLDRELAKLSFEIYRVKGIVRLAAPAGESSPAYSTHILNYAFGRYDLTPFPSLNSDPELEGVSVRLTVMGERGEVARRAKRLAEGLEAEVSM